ncbi:MAG: hypothetical protein H7333_11690, partial [Bdellovibrionales bacterium]|nr:hypothetical protein [Oligoflexia bacterium]
MSKALKQKILLMFITFGILTPGKQIFAQAQLATLSLPSCFITGSGGTVANVNLPIGSICLDKGNLKKLFKACEASAATSAFDFSRCIKKATKKEAAVALQLTQAGDYKICPSGGGGGGCNTLKIERVDGP